MEPWKRLPTEMVQSLPLEVLKMCRFGTWGHGPSLAAGCIAGTESNCSSAPLVNPTAGIPAFLRSLGMGSQAAGWEMMEKFLLFCN